MKDLSRSICLLVWMLVSGIAQAHSSVVVIPLTGSDAQNLKNVITVAMENGNFTDPVVAIDSIPTSGLNMPSSSNRYLIVIGPGVYDIGSDQIVMREWVSIMGSGRETTKITGMVSTGLRDDSSAVVVGSDNVALTNLSIENMGGDDYSTAIYNYNKSPRVERVSAHAQGGSVINTGMQNEEAASPAMTNVSVTASGGITATGLALHKTTSAITNVTATGSGGTVSNLGVTMAFANPTMTNITAEAFGSGTSTSTAVNLSQSSPIMTDVVAEASGSRINKGVYISFNSSPNISNLRSNGGDIGVHVVSSSPFIRNSLLEGGAAGLILEDKDSFGARIVNSQIYDLALDNIPSSTQCRETYDHVLGDVSC